MNLPNLPCGYRPWPKNIPVEHKERKTFSTADMILAVIIGVLGGAAVLRGLAEFWGWMLWR